jgi:hypothetical protein
MDEEDTLFFGSWKNCQGAMLSESERNRDKEERRKKKERS